LGESSTVGLHVQWGDDWDYGADNIVFRIEPTGEIVTPEPVTMTLLGTGLAGIVAARRRRRRTL